MNDPRKPRLLVVDDNADTLTLFATYLELAGFEVTSTNNGSTALQLSTNGFEAISTDLAMPGMDGYELIRRMRAARSKPPIPILAVTGQGVPAANAPQNIGACRLLHKPCDLTDLAETLRHLIRRCDHDCVRCPENPARAGSVAAAASSSLLFDASSPDPHPHGQ